MARCRELIGDLSVAGMWDLRDLEDLRGVRGLLAAGSVRSVRDLWWLWFRGEWLGLSIEIAGEGGGNWGLLK